MGRGGATQSAPWTAVVAATEAKNPVGGGGGGGVAAVGGGSAKRMFEDDESPRHKKAKNDAEKELIVKNRPFFQQTSGLFNTSLFSFDASFGSVAKGDGVGGGVVGGGGGCLSFPHPTSYRFGPRPDFAFGGADSFNSSTSSSSPFTSPSSPRTANAALDNLSNNLNNPFRPMPPPNSPPTPASQTKTPRDNENVLQRGRRSMFPLRTCTKSCNGESTLQHQPRKSRSGTAMDLDNGDFPLGEEYLTERDVSGIRSNPGGGGGGVGVRDLTTFNAPASGVFYKSLAQSIPVPSSQQQQQQQHVQRRRASFAEFSADGLLTSLEDHSGGESMEYFPTVETPCNSPTGKVEIFPPPSSAIFRPEAVAQSLFVAGIPSRRNDEPEKLFVDTDDSDED